MGAAIRQTCRMNAVIRDIDLVNGKVPVTFGDGTATIFNAEFLYTYRNDERNQQLLSEPDED